MEELKDVTLHIYQLQAPEGSSSNNNNDNAASSNNTRTRATSGGGRTPSFLSRFLPTIGMGVYHTSVEIDGYRYTFGAGRGIIKTRAQNEGVPTGAVYQECIALGACHCRHRGEINGVVNKLQTFFHSTAYHAVHRNCNHFTETFATALILHDKLINSKKGDDDIIRLKTFPAWVNRLANTSKLMVGHDEDIVPCNVFAEARTAVGADEKVGWDFDSKNDSDAKKAATAKTKSSSNKQTKRTLTEAQKKALAKIRGGNKT